jgi:hypothetical protein
VATLEEANGAAPEELGRVEGVGGAGGGRLPWASTWASKIASQGLLTFIPDAISAPFARGFFFQPA